MKDKNLRHIPFIILVMIIILGVSQKLNINIKDIIQTNLSQNLRTVKITDEKIKINDKKLSITVKMPQVHSNNTEVERYINSCIRKDINEFINHKRQEIQLGKNKKDINILINYDVSFEDGNLINLIIYKNINDNEKNFILEKDSYVFDLKTGQRIYLDNLFKENSNYKEIIKNYIYDYIDKKNISINKDKIKINKDTKYIINDSAIIIYFNPYKTSKNKESYEFKIPIDIFKNKISIIQTNNIEANIDTQTITKDNKYISSIINIPIVIASNQNISKYINDTITKDIMEFYENAQKNARNYSDILNDQDVKFIANTDFDVKKNSSDLLSINVTYYTYSGGAHGSYEDVSYNFDMKDGTILKLKDLFKEGSDYKKVINNEIRKQIDETVKNDKEYKGIYQFNGIKDNNKFYIQDDDLIIYFDLYEIAPFAAGQPEFLINVDVINHILKEKYINIFR